MTSADPIRAALERLIKDTEYLAKGGEDLDRAWAAIAAAQSALAEQQVGGPSDEELLDLADDSDMDPFEGERSYSDGTVIKEGCWEAWDHQLLAFARAILARWGRPAPQPPAEGEVVELLADLEVAAVTVESEGGDRADVDCLLRNWGHLAEA